MLLQTAKFCSFLWLSNIPLNIYHIFFVCSSVDGLLVCFYILAIVNHATMNTGVWVSLSVFGGVVHISRTFPSDMIVPFLVFWETSIPFFTVAAPVYTLTNSVESSLFSTSSPTFVICLLFGASHSDRCEVISYCGFCFQFPTDLARMIIKNRTLEQNPEVVREWEIWLEQPMQRGTPVNGLVLKHANSVWGSAQRLVRLAWSEQEEHDE